jgi:methyl-accepting chemotaxis protein
MNFLEIVSAHVRWKQRLQSYIIERGEKLDPAEIGRDDHCKLGKWIYGEGQAYAHLPQFEQVRQIHAQFHKHAAAVVVFSNRGDRESAEQVLNGIYAEVSNNLKREIATLAKEVGNQPGG